MKALRIVLDSNYFLHFKDLEEIQWSKLFEEEYSQIIACIVPPVISEIDKHKYSERPRLRERAGKVAKKLKEVLLQQSSECIVLKNGISVELFTSSEDFSHLSNLDDQIVECCRSLKKESDKEFDLLVVTHDTLLQIKLAQAKIEYLDLGSEYLLTLEKSKEEKELSKAKQELKSLKNRLPVLKLLTEDKSTLVEFDTNEVGPNDLADIDSKIFEIKQEYPKHDREVEKNEPLSSMVFAIQSMNGIKEEDWQNYNSKLDDFYDQYESYLREKIEFENFKNRTLELDLELFNEGTLPASEVEIKLHITVSKDVELYAYDDFEDLLESQQPTEPSAPSKPRGFAEVLAGLHSDNYLRTFNNSFALNPRVLNNGGRSNVSYPKITPTNSYNVELDILSVKHHSSAKLRKMYLVFPENSYEKSFKVEYQLICDELPNPVSGEIHFRNVSK